MGTQSLSLNGDDYDGGQCQVENMAWCVQLHICYGAIQCSERFLQFAMNCDLCSLSCCRKQPAAA